MFTNVQEAEKISAYQYIKETLLKPKKLEWDNLVMELFKLQFEHNPVYQQWCKHIHRTPDQVKHLKDIPFLPIDFFKNSRLSIFKEVPQTYFQSSGTGGYGQSKHAAYDLHFYDLLCKQAFEVEYGPLKNWCILALLPAYLEREGSSLVRMAQHFINLSGDLDSGFFLDDYDKLVEVLKKSSQKEPPPYY